VKEEDVMPSKSNFEKEVLALVPALHQFARTMCHQSSDVDDLVQETLLKALRHRDRFTPYGSLKSWLFTIMKNTFCTRIKRARREATIEEWEERAGADRQRAPGSGAGIAGCRGGIQ